MMANRVSSQRHLIDHSKKDNFEILPIQCKICDIMLPNPRELAGHMNICKNGRLFKCNICGKNITSPAHLKVIKVKENQSKKKVHQSVDYN